MLRPFSGPVGNPFSSVATHATQIDPRHGAVLAHATKNDGRYETHNNDDKERTVPSAPISWAAAGIVAGIAAAAAAAGAGVRGPDDKETGVELTDSLPSKTTQKEKTRDEQPAPLAPPGKALPASRLATNLRSAAISDPATEARPLPGVNRAIHLDGDTLQSDQLNGRTDPDFAASQSTRLHGPESRPHQFHSPFAPHPFIHHSDNRQQPESISLPRNLHRLRTSSMP